MDRSAFVNRVNTADIQITGVSESCETRRLSVNTKPGGDVCRRSEWEVLCRFKEDRKKKKVKERREVEANYNDVLSLSSAELGRNVHLVRITEQGKGGTEEKSC